MMNKLISIDKNNNLNLSKLRKTQQDFVKSNLLHTGIVGGYQSGKSLSAVVKVIVKMLQNPGVPIAYYLPTYGLIEDMLIPKFDELFKNLGIKFKYRVKESKIVCPYGEVWMRSMDNPDRIVSYSVGYSLVDEVDVVHINKRDAVMKRISSRNSFKKSTPNSIDFVSTPEGFAYMYDFFVRKANKYKKLYRLRTLDNEENLGIGYIQGLREQYDETELRAYLDGEFVNLRSGTVYKNFDREANHSNRQIREDDILHIGLDFNITNMNAVVNVIDEKPIAVAELTHVYDTETMIRLIRDKYENECVIYPDASAGNRKTSGKSDIKLLKEAGFIVRCKNKNPFVKDRVNAMNRAFRHPLNGTRDYLVNTNNCPELTEALEQQGYKNGEPDKTTGFDHLTDAAGYFIYYYNKPKSKIY